MSLDPHHSYAIAIKDIEVALGIKYPSSAAASLCNLARLMRTPKFVQAFPGARLLATPAEVANARVEVPNLLLPFMEDPQPEWSDYYAFDLAHGDSRVAVWAEHAVVEIWADFGLFIAWLAAFEPPMLQ